MGAKAFGVQSPTEGEDPISWQTWSDGAAAVPTIDGDADWGKLKLDTSGEEGRSAVYDMGSATTRTISLEENRYGTGNEEDNTLQIRGSATSFLQDDLEPFWETYSAPISRDWRYVQIRETTFTISFDAGNGYDDGLEGNGIWYDGTPTAPGEITRVTTPTPRLGTYCAKIRVAPGEYTTGERAEFSIPTTDAGDNIWEVPNTESYIAFSIYIPTGWTAPSGGFGCCMQLHAWDDFVGATPMIEFELLSVYSMIVRGGDFDGTPNEETFALSDGTITLDHWTDWVFKFVWRFDNTGSVDVWRREYDETSFTNVLSESGFPTLYYASGHPAYKQWNYWKNGYYRFPQYPASLDNILYLDSFVRGSDFSDVVMTAFGE